MFGQDIHENWALGQNGESCRSVELSNILWLGLTIPYKITEVNNYEKI